MLCKVCKQDQDDSQFYASNKARCKTCIKADKEAKRKPCPVPNCDEIIDHRALTCKTHSNLARHNSVSPSDFEQLALLSPRKYLCIIPRCGLEIRPQSTMCKDHSAIAGRLSNLTPEQIATHITREKRIATNKQVRQERVDSGYLVCSKCGEKKLPAFFCTKWRRPKNGTGFCKECANKYNRRYYDRVLKHDPNHRLRHSVSAAVLFALKRVDSSKAGKSIMPYLPFTIPELKAHLESLFTPEMNWDNHGSYWCIDHIVPQAFFAYTSLEDPNFKICWQLNNLRPLSILENTRKSSLYNGKLFTYKR